MSGEQSAALAEFARACKAAARAVSLYPGAHPAIGVSLTRLVSASSRLAGGAEMVLVVHPTTLALEDRSPARPDTAIVELAELLHGRMIGTLRVQAAADAEDWRALLLLLSRPVEEMLAEGGIAKAWVATGRGRFEIQEIDYAEVLRERRGSEGASWDRVLAYCLKGESVGLDEGVIDSLVAAVGSSDRFAALLDRFHEKAESEGASVGTRVAALMQLLRATLAAVEQRQAGTAEEVMSTVAGATPHLTPEMLLGLLAHRTAGRSEDAAIANGIADRIDDGTVAALVARSVTAERGASERLAQVFEALVPDGERRVTVLDQARTEAEATEFGADPRFGDVWQGAVSMLTYSDEGAVSAAYATELSGARAQAIEVERLSDDPPEQIAAWLSTITPPAVQALDLELTLDLLRIEADPRAWAEVAALTVQEIERRALLGDLAGAQRLAGAIAATVAGPHADLQEPAMAALAALARGPLARHVVSQLRKATEADVAAWTRLCQTVGPRLVLPFAETLAVEEHTHTIRRIRELLIAFGAEGRRAVEPLKKSPNPAVRRTAVDLLRVFGGNEALRELTPLLNDADPQVQRDAVRAIVQIGTPEALGVIDRACAASDAAREIVVRELIGLRDTRAIPALAAVLRTTTPRGALTALHEAIIDTLASLGAHSDSTAALRAALDRGDWWAPRRTSTLRRAAAAALKRIGSPEALEALAEAARNGSRGVRGAARLALEGPGRGDAR
jgi:hypothetical protein